MEKKPSITYIGRQCSFIEGDIDILKSLKPATEAFENIIARGKQMPRKAGQVNPDELVYNLDDQIVALATSSGYVEARKTENGFRVSFQVKDDEIGKTLDRLFEEIISIR